jgi:hypothetical protein
LGTEHPDLASSLKNLGALYMAEHRYTDAGTVLERALKIESAQLSPNHPDAAGTMMQYARLLRVTRRKAEAGRMEARARAIAKHNAQQNLTGYTVDAADLKK